MNTTTLIVVAMCALMIAMGVWMARISKRNRTPGVVIAALGLMFIVGYFLADDTAPLPGSGTPTPELPFSFPSNTNP
ncbi:MAG: hypothetical protein WBA63_07345 [Thermomicrobiales bacterium]